MTKKDSPKGNKWRQEIIDKFEWMELYDKKCAEKAINLAEEHLIKEFGEILNEMQLEVNQYRKAKLVKRTKYLKRIRDEKKLLKNKSLEQLANEFIIDFPCCNKKDKKISQLKAENKKLGNTILELHKHEAENKELKARINEFDEKDALDWFCEGYDQAEDEEHSRIVKLIKSAKIKEGSDKFNNIMTVNEWNSFLEELEAKLHPDGHKEAKE